jgi:hypothetical protein
MIESIFNGCKYINNKNFDEHLQHLQHSQHSQNNIINTKIISNVKKILFVEFFKNYERIRTIILIKNLFPKLDIDFMVLMNYKLKNPNGTNGVTNNFNIIYYDDNVKLHENDIISIANNNYLKIYLFDYRLVSILSDEQTINNDLMHLCLFKNTNFKNEKIILRGLENYNSKIIEKDNINIHILYKMVSFVNIDDFNDEIALKKLVDNDNNNNIMNTVLLFEFKK